MNKAELIAALAEQTGISKKDADVSVNAFEEIVQKELKKGEKVAIAGFGTFDVSTRKAREGRNPHTGESIKIPASKSPNSNLIKHLKICLNNASW